MHLEEGYLSIYCEEREETSSRTPLTKRRNVPCSQRRLVSESFPSLKIAGNR